MAYENRKGHSYFYRKERIGNRVKSRYIGKGELAELLSQWDEIGKDEREYEAGKERRERANFEKIDQKLDEIEQKTNDLVENFLINNGFYKTKSREWRVKGK